MLRAAHAPSLQIAHVSITLDDVVPEVSRIVAMPLGIRLDMLHLIIQAAMGWTNSHLWLIHARGSTWGVPDPDYADDTMPANRTSLLDMIADIGTNRFEYVYDLGDHWSHTIKICKADACRARYRLPTVDRRRSAAARWRTAAALRVTWKCSKPSATWPILVMPR